MMMKLGGTYCKPNSVNLDLEICAHDGVGKEEDNTSFSSTKE
jgi:hypothetical protein